MELRHLRYFVAVAEELHFGRAAERLHIAQPPLSQQIRHLEDELGVALLERNSRNVRLTAAGAVFLTQARKVLDAAGAASEAARRAAQGETGALSIGFVRSATYEFLPRAIRSFSERFPEVALNLVEMTSSEQVEAVEQRRIHLGLVRPPIDTRELARVIVTRERLVIALPRNHPLAARRTLALKDLANEHFILFPRYPRPSWADYIVTLCREAGFEPRTGPMTVEVLTGISLVGAGLGVAVVPVSVQNLYPEDVVYREFRPPRPMTQLIAIHRNDEGAPTLRNFLAASRQDAGAKRRR